MTKRSVSYTMGGNPKNRMSNVLAGDDRTGGRGPKRNPSVVRASDPANAASGYGSGGLGAPVTRMAAYGKIAKDQSRVTPTAVQRATVPGGRGIMALDGVRLKPTANAPKATVTGAKVSPAGAAPKRSVGETIRTFVAEKLTPNRKSTPMRGTNLGVSSGKTTGKTVSRGGTGGRTTGGGRSTGGGYSNAGPAGMGASGRGTGGKR